MECYLATFPSSYNHAPHPLTRDTRNKRDNFTLTRKRNCEKNCCILFMLSNFLLINLINLFPVQMFVPHVMILPKMAQLVVRMKRRSPKRIHHLFIILVLMLSHVKRLAPSIFAKECEHQTLKFFYEIIFICLWTPQKSKKKN